MSWRSVAKAYSRDWVTTHWFDLVDGEHDGYLRLQDPVSHRRVVVFLKPDVWLVWDQLSGKQRHEMELLLHTRPDCNVEGTMSGVDFSLVSPGGTRLNAWVLEKGNQAGLPEIVVGSETERGAWFSSNYGIRVPTRALRVKCEFVGTRILMTCFSTSDQITSHSIGQDRAIGLQLMRGDQWEESLHYLTDGDRIPEMGGVHFIGKLLYHRKVAGVSRILWASHFREISVDGLLEIRSPVQIDKLVLEGKRCEVMLDVDPASALHFTARDGVQLVVNGRPVPISPHSSTVTS